MCVLHCFSSVQLFVTLWTLANQAPLSLGSILKYKEHWSGLPFPPPGDLPNSGIKPTARAAPASQADSLPPSQDPLVQIMECTLIPTSCFS